MIIIIIFVFSLKKDLKLRILRINSLHFRVFRNNRAGIAIVSNYIKIILKILK